MSHTRQLSFPAQKGHSGPDREGKEGVHRAIGNLARTGMGGPLPPPPPTKCLLGLSGSFSPAFQTEKQSFWFHFHTSNIMLGIKGFPVRFQRLSTHLRPSVPGGCLQPGAQRLCQALTLWWVLVTSCLQVVIFAQLGINEAGGLFPGNSFLSWHSSPLSGHPSESFSEWVLQWPRKQKGGS